MRPLFDHLGRAVSLGREIGRGGEGVVYEVRGNENLVAKLYLKSVEPEKCAKLASMLRLSSPELAKFAAWPLATLHHQPGHSLCGLVMPRIGDGKEIHQLYSPGDRRTKFPQADWRFLVRTAQNCATAFAILHDKGIVVGDVNQGNVFVTSQAIAKLIDCDSFQVSDNGKSYRCLVGVPHFTPPELQKARFDQVLRTPDHDSFGLGVLIFHLLFMGRHPFVGYQGDGEMPLERAISEHRFAYGCNGHAMRMMPPPHSLTLAEVSPDLATLFERCFSTISSRQAGRPTAAEWRQSLASLEQQLRKCEDDPGHYYYGHLRACPWCKIAGNGGPSFFISVSFHVIERDLARVDINVLWSEIKAIPSPQSVTIQPVARVAASAIRPMRIPSDIDNQRTVRWLVASIVGLATVLLIVGLAVSELLLAALPLLTVFIPWWGVLEINSPVRRERRARKKRVHRLRRNFERVRDSMSTGTNNFEQHFVEKRLCLMGFKEAYEQAQLQRDRSLQQLQQTVRESQLEQFLSQFLLSNADIPGIGAGRIVALESYGIQTAGDISYDAVFQVPGFGDALTARVVAWRASLQSQFRFDPSRGVPVASVQAVEMKCFQTRTHCVRLLQNGAKELMAISATARNELERHDRELAGFESELAQAKADLAV